MTKHLLVDWLDLLQKSVLLHFFQVEKVLEEVVVPQLQKLCKAELRASRGFKIAAVVAIESRVEQNLIFQMFRHFGISMFKVR